MIITVGCAPIMQFVTVVRVPAQRCLKERAMTPPPLGISRPNLLKVKDPPPHRGQAARYMSPFNSVPVEATKDDLESRSHFTCTLAS